MGPVKRLASLSFIPDSRTRNGRAQTAPAVRPHPGVTPERARKAPYLEPTNRWEHT